jgi:hypothetical protein
MKIAVEVPFSCSPAKWKYSAAVDEKTFLHYYRRLYEVRCNLLKKAFNFDQFGELSRGA